MVMTVFEALAIGMQEFSGHEQRSAGALHRGRFGDDVGSQIEVNEDAKQRPILELVVREV